MRDPSTAAWRKSSRGEPRGNCVEITALPDGAVAVRGGKDPRPARCASTAPR